MWEIEKQPSSIRVSVGRFEIYFYRTKRYPLKLWRGRTGFTVAFGPVLIDYFFPG